VAAAWDLVIFDNDGVLVDSEPAANRILADLLTGYGRPTTYEDAVAEHLGTSLARVRATVEAAGTPVPADFEDEYHRRLFAAFDGGLAAVPGVAEALGTLGAPICVASSGSHERIRRALRAVGLAGRFDGRVFSAEDVARGKPAPDLFLHAARSLGASPARCAVVEDSPLGVEAAIAAGMTAFGYAGLTPAGRLAAAPVVFARMAELPGLLASHAPAA
jgi:HAD superfamily hydrolase (TIGR01509 family)